MDTSSPHRRRRRSGLYNPEFDGASDADLVARVQLEASNKIENGPAWRYVRDRVHTVAVPTLRKLIMRGTVWGLYHQLGGQASSDLRIPVGGVDAQDAYDLAAETVLGALPVLRHQLLAGRWSADGGASVVTWSVNLTILRLPGYWRAWRKTRLLRLPDRFDEKAPDRDEQPEAIIYSVEFERHIELLDDELLEAVLRLDCSGFSDAEIAEELGRTVKSVEYRLGVARQRVREQARRERERDARQGVA